MLTCSALLGPGSGGTRPRGPKPTGLLGLGRSAGGWGLRTSGASLPPSLLSRTHTQTLSHHSWPAPALPEPCSDLLTLTHRCPHVHTHSHAHTHMSCHPPWSCRTHTHAHTGSCKLSLTYMSALTHIHIHVPSHSHTLRLTHSHTSTHPSTFPLPPSRSRSLHCHLWQLTMQNMVDNTVHSAETHCFDQASRAPCQVTGNTAHAFIHSVSQSVCHTLLNID